MSSTDTYTTTSTSNAQQQHEKPQMWSGRPIISRSPYGLFHILDFMPREGEEGMVLTVDTLFDADPRRPLCIRLIIGNHCTTTAVRTLIAQTERDPALMRVECTIPAFYRHASLDASVPLTIQAMDGQDRVVDSVTFGDFSYWQRGESLPSPSS